MRNTAIFSGICAVIVLVLAFVFLDDEVELLQNSSIESATISGCAYKEFTRKGRRNSQYATVAVTESGLNVTGHYIHPTRAGCEKRLYRDTKVLVADLGKEHNRIYSFFDFWLVPFLFGFVFVVCALSTLSATKYRKPFIYTSHFVVITTIFFLFATYWVNYESEPNSLTLGAGDTNSAKSAFSSNLLDRCIRNTLLEGGYQHERDIQILSCQKMSLTDLSRLQGLNGLERLYLQDNKLENLNTLPNLPNLRVLSIAANDTTSLSGIGNAPSLQELQSNLNQISSIDELRTLEKLETVAFLYNSVSDISALANLQNLKSVNFTNNEISDISALANKPKLADIGLFGNSITDISPLFDNLGLEKLAMVGRKNRIPCEQVEYLLSRISFKIHEQWRELCQ